MDLTFGRPPPLSVLTAITAVREATISGRTAHLVVTGTLAELFTLAAPYGIEHLVTHEPDLEDIFLTYHERQDGTVRTVFGKALHDQRRALIGGSIGIVALVLIEAALWQSIRDMPDLSRLLSNYPEAMRKLFDLETFGTGTGSSTPSCSAACCPWC